jgi:hypothetical protein
MPALLIKFLPHIIAGLAIVAVAWVILGWRADSKALEGCKERNATMIAQMQEIIAENEKNRQLSEDYYDKLETIDRELASIKRVRPAKCICPVSSAAPTCNAGTGAAGEFPKEDGITTESLYNFAADAERVRQQLLACQVWAGGSRAE